MPLPALCVRLSGWLHEVRSLGWGQEVATHLRITVFSFSRTLWHHLQGGSVLRSRQSWGLLGLQTAVGIG